MSRYVLTAALLMLAFAAQGGTAARQGAGSSGGSCPESQAPEAGESVAPTLAPDKPRAAPAAPTTSPAPEESRTLSQTRTSTRWHSFLPGMFK